MKKFLIVSALALSACGPNAEATQQEIDPNEIILECDVSYVMPTSNGHYVDVTRVVYKVNFHTQAVSEFSSGNTWFPQTQYKAVQKSEDWIEIRGNFDQPSNAGVSIFVNRWNGAMIQRFDPKVGDSNVGFGTCKSVDKLSERLF